MSVAVEARWSAGIGPRALVTSEPACDNTCLEGDGDAMGLVRSSPVMEALGQIHLALILAACLVPGCYRSHERGGDSAVDADVPNGPLVWVLVHPSDAPRGPGLFLFDEGRQEVVRQLALPAGVTSPQALAWDGRSLWLGGVDEEPAVRELDPDNGRVLSRWPGVVTEGIAVDGDNFWYSGVTSAFIPLTHVRRDGSVVSSAALPGVVTVQDLVSASGSLYYLVNDERDRIVRADGVTGDSTVLSLVGFDAPYALGFDGTYLAVAAEGRIRRFDVSTGALVEEGPLAVPGWITAIAFVPSR